MTTLSFYARGDASTANNPSLNVESKTQQPTVEITFNSGASGDIILDGGGGVDPDTTVTIDGTTYDFTLEMTGDLPLNNGKVPDALEGKQVTVISVVIDGNTERFFFVTDGSGTYALMEQFGNGAIPLDNTDTSPTTVYICFCGGTDILTPGGYRKVEKLRAGDLVLNDAGDAVPILWIGQSTASREDMQNDPARCPIRIPANSVRAGVPHSDLYVSAQHRMVLEDAQMTVSMSRSSPRMRMGPGHVAVIWRSPVCAAEMLTEKMASAANSPHFSVSPAFEGCGMAPESMVTPEDRPSQP